MGYNRQKALPVWVLDFEAYPGLEIRARQANFAGLRAVGVALSVLRSGRANESQMLAALDLLLDAFAVALVDWTLETGDDDRPVPATKAGLAAQDLDFLLDITKAWADATTRPAPTEVIEHEEVDVGDDTFELEQSLPMELLAG